MAEDGKTGARTGAAGTRWASEPLEVRITGGEAMSTETVDSPEARDPALHSRAYPKGCFGRRVRPSRVAWSSWADRGRASFWQLLHEE